MNQNRSQFPVGAVACRPRSGKKLLVATLLSALLATAAQTAYGGGPGDTGTATTVRSLATANFIIKASVLPSVMVMLNNILTVTVSVGGSVKVNPGNITNCTNANSPCTAAYSRLVLVSDPPSPPLLTATANAGYTFSGWSGDCSGTANSVSVTMGSNRSCTATFKAGSSSATGTATNETISVPTGGGMRTYTIYKPSNYSTAAPLPLIFVLHGDGGTGPGTRSDFGVNQGFEKIAEMNGGAIIVYPTGLNATWKEADTVANLDKDVNFIDALVDNLVGTGKVNANRVFVTGFSRGAYFIPDLVLHSRTAFKGFATHAGSTANTNVVWNSSWTVDGQEFWYPSGTNGNRNQPMAALQVSGMSDNTGGVGYDDNQFLRNTWRAGNKCKDIAPVNYDPAPCVAYQGCSKPEVWCPIPGMGHTTWPAPSVVSGVTQAAYVTWKFFSEQN